MRIVIGSWLIAVVVFFACQSVGQAHFRITYSPRPQETSSVTLDGRVSNDADNDVLDVWVTVEGLDTSGKVLTTAITYVLLIPRHGSATFVAKLPVAEGIQSFHLAVTSYRDGVPVPRSVQSP
ncbi:MAG TPA: hypothetical protein VMS64_00725 [Candidatus Methylomirabilis sp.]|nr:hypothetical protein [Candidatus Methylomirabilis sp.]